MAATASRPGEDEVARFVDAIADQVKRDDSRALIGIMTDATGEDPKLWGSVIGFGTCHYRYESGREGHSAKVGFAPRKTNLTIYLLSGMVGYDDLLSRLGKHTTGKSCIYVERLADLDMQVLTDLLARAVKHIDQVEMEFGALPRMSEMPPYRAD